MPGSLRFGLLAVLRHVCPLRLSPKRTLTSVQAMTVLRPFYRAVHPDLFGQYPQQKVVNEESLKHLNSYIECSRGSVNLVEGGGADRNISLQFFLHPSVQSTANGVEPSESTPKPVTIQLHRGDLRTSLQSILATFNMNGIDSGQTEELLSTPLHGEAGPGSVQDVSTTLSDLSCYFDEDGEFFNKEHWTIDQKRPSLSTWLRNVAKEASVLRETTKPTRKAVEELTKRLCEEYRCSEVRISTQWSPAVSLGAVKRLDQFLRSLDKELLAVSLQESVVHLSDRNGVTVNGEVHFDCNSLIKDWAKVLPRISRAKQMVSKFESFEEFISSSLGNMRVERHPLMSPSSYWIALKHLHSQFNPKTSFRAGSMEDHVLMIIPPSMSPSIKSNGVFLIPADMSQFEVARFVSSEERRAVKIREVNERSLSNLQHSLAVLKEQLNLKSLSVSHVLTRDEVLSFSDLLQASLSGQLWREGIEGSDFHILRGHHVKVDCVRGLSPQGVIHLAWDMK